MTELPRGQILSTSMRNFRRKEQGGGGAESIKEKLQNIPELIRNV